MYVYIWIVSLIHCCSKNRLEEQWKSEKNRKGERNWGDVWKKQSQFSRGSGDPPTTITDFSKTENNRGWKDVCRNWLLLQVVTGTTKLFLKNLLFLVVAAVDRLLARFWDPWHFVKNVVAHREYETENWEPFSEFRCNKLNYEIFSSCLQNDTTKLM